jgi:hypothetical protein
VNADSGIRTPQDRRGKRVGTPEYQMTAAVWIRGMLSDEYNIRGPALHISPAAKRSRDAPKRSRFRCRPRFGYSRFRTIRRFRR